MLHNVIAKFVPGHGATAEQIADRVNRSGLYTRADGKPVPATQVDARLSKYPDHYIFIDGKWYEKNMDIKFISDFVNK